MANEKLIGNINTAVHNLIELILEEQLKMKKRGEEFAYTDSELDYSVTVLREASGYIKKQADIEKTNVRKIADIEKTNVSKIADIEKTIVRKIADIEKTIVSKITDIYRIHDPEDEHDCMDEGEQSELTLLSELLGRPLTESENENINNKRKEYFGE